MNQKNYEKEDAISKELLNICRVITDLKRSQGFVSSEFKEDVFAYTLEMLTALNSIVTYKRDDDCKE